MRGIHGAGNDELEGCESSQVLYWLFGWRDSAESQLIGPKQAAIRPGLDGRPRRRDFALQQDT